MYVSDATKIVEYILLNGGTVASASRELEIKLTPKIRECILRFQPDIERYRYALKRHGSWFVLPSDKAESRDDQKVDAVCLLCNQISKVSLINIEAGRSTQCLSCGMRNRSQRKIVCKETGDSFSSIRQLADQLGEFNSYQSIRHSLRKTGIYLHDGKEYTFAWPHFYTAFALDLISAKRW